MTRANQLFRIWDGKHLLDVDGVTTALEVIEYHHSEIHAGEGYFVVLSALADNTDAIEVRIQTPDTTKWGHFIMIVDAALAARAELWASTTKTDVIGNRITPFNRNQNSENVSGMTLCHTPGGSQSGDAQLSQYIGAAASPGKASVGGEPAGGRSEFDLKQNTTYLIKATSRTDNNAISIILDWYEHANATPYTDPDASKPTSMFGF